MVGGLRCFCWWVPVRAWLRVASVWWADCGDAAGGCWAVLHFFFTFPWACLRVLRTRAGWQRLAMVVFRVKQYCVVSQIYD